MCRAAQDEPGAGRHQCARAAGAEQYAATEFTAAFDALRRSEEAVIQNDYRLALSHAIDSRSSAQRSTKTAVEARAKARGDAERAVAQVHTLVTQAVDRLRDQDAARLARRTVQEPRAVIEGAQNSMQEARAALTGDQYPRAIALTSGLAARVQAALNAIDAPDREPPSRRRR